MPERLRLGTNVRSVIDTDGAVVLDLPHGKYYSLNAIGAQVWQGLEAGRTVEEIAAALIERYGVSADAVHRDVAEFLSELQQRRLIDVGN